MSFSGEIQGHESNLEVPFLSSPGLSSVYQSTVPQVPPTRPRYKNLPRALALVSWQLARGAPTSLSAIEKSLFAGMTPPPKVTGDQLIPAESPFVLIFNHYENDQVAAWWGPFLMTQVIAERRALAMRRDESHMRWLMAREWWYPRGLGRLLKQPLTRVLFARLARVYGFIRMPPVLEGDLTRGEGVGGVRQALALTRGDHPALVGLAPEGNTGPGGTLRVPPAGVGLFLLLLTRDKIPLLPIGWYQDEHGVLTINVGAPFRLVVPQVSDRRARDRAAVTQAMNAIRRLLPERLWGAYEGGEHSTGR